MQAVETYPCWQHVGRAADLVRALKYGNQTAAVTEIADQMALVAPRVDIVTWCPASPRQRRLRGFDQSELLARAVAHRLQRPVRRLLRRARNDLPQTARDAAGRRVGPRLHPVGRPLRGAPTVLIVDDVSTTGTTVAVAGATLRRRGAGHTVAVVATQADSGGFEQTRPSRSVYN